MPEAATARSPEPLADRRREPADHRVPIPGGDWSLWRWLVLRGAGFPVSGVLDLTQTGSAEAAERLDETQDRVEALLDRAAAELREDLSTAEGERKRALRRINRRVRKGRAPDEIDAETRAAETLTSLREALEAREHHATQFEERFEEETLELSRRLEEAAEDPRFREALTWQNRQALHDGADFLLRHPIDEDGRRNSRRRHQEEMVARYLQRYCTKNDTIGFFGPVAWVRWEPEGEALRIEPGSSLLRDRRVYFESWAVDALTESLSDPELLAWMAPRRVAYLRLEGDALFHPVRGRQELEPLEREVFARCDGTLRARDLADQLVASDAVAVDDTEEVYDLLDDFVERQWVVWELEIPVGLHPEKELRRVLEGVGDPELRRRSLEPLDVLESAREDVAEAAGDPEALNLALQDLEMAFTRATGAGATRREGRTYAGRTVVFEDCLRDLDMQLGPEALETLGPPMSLLLTSARWLTWEMARRFRQEVNDIYDRLVERTGETEVEAVQIWSRSQPLLFGARATLAQEVEDAFQSRWTDLLDLDFDARRVSRSTADLRPQVEEVFAAPGPGWEAACYQSPDVMIEAADAEAVRRGDYRFVMGELHVGVNTLGNTFFVDLHPRSEDLYEGIRRDLPEPRLVPVTPRNWPQLTARTLPALMAPRDYRLVTSPDACPPADARILPIADLVVERRDGALRARSVDGRLSFDILELFGEMLNLFIRDRFHVLPSRPHVPRVTLDDHLVIRRESWSFPAEELEFAEAETGHDRFLAARRWAQAHGLPRFVYFRVPNEPKPFYVDFSSTLFIDILSKTVRQAREQEGPDAEVSLSEMLPGPDQVWLIDAEGQRYTSEMRILAVDPKRAVTL